MTTDIKIKERGILFSGPMVRAILEGRKTQTRRPVKPQPGDHPDDDGYMASVVSRCPYGQPGDRLWVRETWGILQPSGGTPGGKPYDPWAVYRSDDKPWPGTREFSGWKPSIHMPRWASRITLEITNVRVERVQDMGVEDFKAEGYRVDPSDCFSDVNTLNKIRRPFRKSWDSIYPGSWDRNDWVWIVEFKVVEQ